MYDARAIANYFLARAASRDTPITVMTLLKVLYFAHAWHLAEHGEPLIAQPFEAWRYGPVVRVVYEQLRGQEAKPIRRRLTSFCVSERGFVETPAKFDDGTQKFLDNIFDYYSRFHPFTLSDLTHEKGSPWDLVWQSAEKRAVPGMLISNESIMDWFRRGGGVQSFVTQ